MQSSIKIWLGRGVGTGLADRAVAGPMTKPTFMIQLKTLFTYSLHLASTLLNVSEYRSLTIE